MVRSLAAILVIAAALAPAVAATVSVESERDGTGVNIRASAVLRADVPTAWRVLTDYDRYVDFIPDLRVSRVVARHGSTVTVEQSGDAVWLLTWPLDITFEIEESPPSRLQSRAVAGSLRVLVSSYALTPFNSGARLEYSGHVEAGFPLFGQIEQRAAERNVARQFRALVEEIDRQGANGHPQPVESGKLER